MRESRETESYVSATSRQEKKRERKREREGKREAQAEKERQLIDGGILVEKQPHVEGEVNVHRDPELATRILENEIPEFL